MNKFLTSLIVLATASTTSAQDFTVSGPDGKTYSDGDVINIGYTFDGMGYNWTPDLKVTVNEATSLITHKSQFTVSVSASKGGIVQFCGIEDGCTIVGNDEVTRSNGYAKGSTFALGVEILDYPNPPTASVAATVKISDGKQTTNLTINFLNTEEAGIHAAELAGSSITFSGRTLHHELERPEKFTLYNIGGRVMIDRTLSGSGTLNLGGIPAGVYVYRLGNKTGKTLLK